MSRTGIDAATLARSLRGMAGDGSMEWVMEPIQASVLLDVADALDENAKLREEVVRCRDCKFFDTRKCKSQWPFRLDGFCAWGKRREDA